MLRESHFETCVAYWNFAETHKQTLYSFERDSLIADSISKKRLGLANGWCPKETTECVEGLFNCSLKSKKRKLLGYESFAIKWELRWSVEWKDVVDDLSMCTTLLVNLYDMTCQCVVDDLSNCTTWLVNVYDITCQCVRHYLAMCMTWLVNVCDITCQCASHYFSMCVRWLVNVHDTTLSMCMTLQVNLCDMTCQYVWHDLSICARWLECETQ